MTKSGVKVLDFGLAGIQRASLSGGVVEGWFDPVPEQERQILLQACSGGGSKPETLLKTDYIKDEPRVSRTVTGSLTTPMNPDVRKSI